MTIEPPDDRFCDNCGRVISGEAALEEQPRPTIADFGEPALANSTLNGVDNSHPSRVIPPPAWWETVLAEWRVVGTILAPFAVTAALWLVPATKGELDLAKSEVTTRMDVDKASSIGQFQAVNAKIDAMRESLLDTKGDLKEMRGDVKELLKRLPGAGEFSEDSPPKPIQANPPPERKVKRRPEKKQTGILGF